MTERDEIRAEWVAANRERWNAEVSNPFGPDVSAEWDVHAIWATPDGRISRLRIFEDDE